MKRMFQKYYKHIILFTIIIITGNYALYYFHTSQEDHYLQLQTKFLKAKYDTNYKYLKIVSSDIYEVYKGNKTIIKILQNASNADEIEQSKLRKELYKLLKSRYKRLKNMGVEHFHFHLPDNTSFLRMHKPHIYGDNLSNIRQSVTFTNNNKTATEGFEVGRIAHGFRFVYPLFDTQKNHLGSVEISFSSKQLLDIVSDDSFIDTRFLVSKNAINKKIWSKEIYETAWESSDFLLERKTHLNDYEERFHDGIKNDDVVLEIAEKMKTQESFSIATTYASKSVTLSFVPIVNIRKDKTLAYLVVYRKSDFLDTIAMQKYYLSIILYSVVFLIFIFGFYVINSREKLQKIAHYDDLTKLPNRTFFYIELQRELKRAQRHNANLALLFLDLDGFKAVNDTYGHGAGDQLLREVSQRIRNSVRDIDVVARLGGDEFTILLTDISHSSEALFVAKKIIYSLNKEFLIKRKAVFIGASIGISIYPDHGTDIDELIRNADNMMYNVKNSGKNSAKIYEKESS